MAIKKPTIQDSATRNDGVDAERVRKFQETAKALRDQRTGELGSYGVSHPFRSVLIQPQGVRSSLNRSVSRFELPKS